MAVEVIRAGESVMISVVNPGTENAVATCSKVCLWIIGRPGFSKSGTFAMQHTNKIDCTAVDFAGNHADGDTSVGKFPRCGMIQL